MFFCCDYTAASMSSFMPTILTELGWTSAIAQLMSIPVWATAIVCQVFGCWISGRISSRAPFMMTGILISLVGWIIQMVFSGNKGLAPGVRYFSLFCMSGGTFLQMSMAMGWMAVNLRGRASVAVGTAAILGLGNCANFVASNVFPKKEAPYYPAGFGTGLGITLAGAVLCIVFTGLLWRHNKVLEKKRSEFGGEDTQEEYMYLY